MGELAAVLRPSLGIDLQKAADIGANCVDYQEISPNIYA
jgi:hypothetical protein